MSNKDYLPIQYRIEFYEESTLSDPVYSIHTSSVPFLISIGDKIDPHSWCDSDIPSNKVYQVADVTHLIGSVQDSHVFHSLSIVVTPIYRKV